MRIHALLTLAIAPAIALATISCSSTDQTDESVRFATMPVSDDPTERTPVHVMAELLEKESGIPVEVTDVPTYSAIIEAVRAGHEDIGIMSGFPSALAVNTGEVDSLVAWPGTAEPVSTCLVMKDSPLQSLKDIQPTTTVAFADPASSSGFFMPTHMLHQAGLKADEDFTKLFSGGHDRSFIALKAGQADVACTSTLFPPMAGQGNPQFPFAKDETRSIGESIPMPISLSVLGSKHMSETKRVALMKAIPAVFADSNREPLGMYMKAIPEGAAPMMSPSNEVFQPFVDIAAVANVDISDLK